jgi:hypothetical protein
MNLTIHYPWKQTEKGQGFFIPCLDTDAIREDGLRTALKDKLKDARAEVGIRKGLIGVWFYRTPSRTDAPS